MFSPASNFHTKHSPTPKLEDLITAPSSPLGVPPPGRHENRLPILSPLDAALLRAEHLVTEPTNGLLMLHKRFLNRYSSVEYHHIPPPVAGFGTKETVDNREWESSLTDYAYAAIPDMLLSVCTLLHLGFNNEAAAYIWVRWITWCQQRKDWDANAGTGTFLEMAMAYAMRARFNPTGDDPDEAWTRCMKDGGISHSLQTAIMDPIFRQERGTKSCWFWLIDSIRGRWDGLREVSACSLARELLYNPCIHTLGPPGRGLWMLSPCRALGEEVGKADSLLHTLLFKSLPTSRINDCITQLPEEQEYSPIATSLAEDFSPGGEQSYRFTPHHGVALRDAAWTKRRLGIYGVTLLRLAVENESLLEVGPQRAILSWPSREWKEWVWHCRGRHPLEKHVLADYDNLAVIIGDSCGKSDAAFQTPHLSTPDGLVESDLLRTEPRKGLYEPPKAQQYVFRGEPGRQWLDHMTQKPITLHPLIQLEFEEWIREQTFVFPPGLFNPVSVDEPLPPHPAAW